MVLPSDLVAKFRTICPTYGQGCASVLLQRGMIERKDQEKVVELINQFLGAPEAAAGELAQRGLITAYHKAGAAEFMKRVGRRLLLTSHGLTAGELCRILRVNRTVAVHMTKGTRELTADHVKLLVERLFLACCARAA